MAWTPPTKIVMVLSTIFVFLGLILLIELIWGSMGFYSSLPLLTFAEPNLNSKEVWYIIGLFCMFFAWLLLVIGVRMVGL